MEEILASIRRIIAEGEREAQATPPAEPTSTVPEATKAPPPAAEPIASPAPEPEILVLTQMVQDDGSVVSLQAALPAAPTPSEEIGSAPVFAASEPTSGAASATEPEPDAVPPVVEQSRIEVAVENVAAGVSDALSAPSAPAVDVGFATPEISEESIYERVELSLTTTPLAEERTAVPADAPKKPEIVSEEALAASTAALSQLAQSVSRTREPAPGQSKTVDELVREAVEPMLKQWLDANLPRIVERMVREAIDRVVRRVE